MATQTPQNGSYLQHADPQNFPANATGAPTNTYQSQPATPATSSSGAPTEPAPAKDEIGWYFVEQYYTTLNKSPERVHLFYNKKSTFVWGTEGESLNLAHGRPEIQEKIAAQEFKDCKVRVSNVDSQASLGNGIVIQVLGEMSNNGLPNRKFSQTFFLAEQPNGYYVLNDIFRYLKDDDDIEEGDEYTAYSEGAAESTSEAVEDIAEELAEDLKDMTVKEISAVEVDVAGETVRVEESTTTTMEPEAVEAVVEEVLALNGEASEANGSPAPAEVPETQAEEAPVEPEAEPVVEEPVAAEKPATPAPTPVEEPKRAPVPAPAPVPARPKTWANLLAGPPAAAAATPAPAAKASAPASTPAAAPTPAAAQAPAAAAAASQAAAPAASAANTSSSGGSWQTADNKRHSRASNITAGQTLAYVKNVSEAVSDEALREALSKFGPLKHMEIVRPRNCAFVEFSTTAAFSAANAANPHNIAGANVLVEERRRQNTSGAFGGNRGGVAGRADGRPTQGRGGYQPRDGQRGGRGGVSGPRGGFASGRGGGQGFRTGSATAGN